MKLELRSVRIKNCGPIDDIKLDFFDATGKTLPVCVIGGANGSGKTTILEAIVSVAGLLESRTFNSHLTNRRDAYIEATLLINGLKIAVFQGKLPNDMELKEPYVGWEVAQGGPAWKITEAAFELSRRIKHQAGALPLYSTKHYSRDKATPSIIYLPHNRSLEPVSGKEIRKEDDPYQFVYRFETVRQFPGSLTSYLIWLDYAEPERYAQIQQFLNDLDFEGKTFRVDRKSLSVVVKTAKGEEHPLHELSSGEQNLLIILIELHRKLIPGSIVLIDEIENSLHPAFQHRLAQGLLALQREIPYQLIVTTHARAFVEIFGPERTLLLTQF